jgi:hypothetical protein
MPRLRKEFHPILDRVLVITILVIALFCLVMSARADIFL